MRANKIAALFPRLRQSLTSALKMAFAAWTKGTTALLAAIRALARAEGVDDALQDQWQTLLPDLAEGADRRIAASGPKAWRYIGEMKEIARTFSDHNLPEGFHLAAADVYRSIAATMEAGTAVDTSALVSALAQDGCPRE